MAVCTICNKGKMAGRRVRHKHSGLWERKAPKSTRVFLPNVQKKTLMQNGKQTVIRICTKCLKRIKNYPGWKGYLVPAYNSSSESESVSESV